MESNGPKSDHPTREEGKLGHSGYEKTLSGLQDELVALQGSILQRGLRVVILFEGRDAAGKGGVIKRITEHLNPRYCRVVALGKPTERECSQWYFQRYVEHLPAAGEMVLFDRSWYNRAGVERVMGFCSDSEYGEFLESCPEFERLLQRSGIILLKYWFSVSEAEQERRFQKRLHDPKKQWKLSPVDIESRNLWVEYSQAKDRMMEETDTDESPWYIIESDNKKRARLNCIAHLLDQVPHLHALENEPLELPPRAPHGDYRRPPRSNFRQVPDAIERRDQGAEQHPR